MAGCPEYSYMPIHRFPAVGRVSLNHWDYLNLLLGLAFVLWSPLHWILVDTTPLHYIWGIMVILGIGLWIITLLLGRRAYRLLRALDQRESTIR